MSSRSVWNVWRHSQHKGAELLVLLKLAEFADPSGAGTFPPLTELATAARISVPEVQVSIAELKFSGEFDGEGLAGTPYRIQLSDGATRAPAYAAAG